jgi:deoxyadenosine/deoxycytidine kinase
MIKRLSKTMSKCTGSIYSIEGNIACGKSTILDHLNSKNDKNIHCMQEPVSEWTNMKSGTDVLRLFYEEKDRWAFSFENLVQLSRLKSHYDASNRIFHEMIQNKNHHIKIFMERSIFSSFNVFTINTFEDSRSTQSRVEFDILKKYFSLFKNEWMDKNAENSAAYKIIYIRTDPCVAFDRLKLRNRQSEQKIDADYLEKIHTKYENWILNLDTDNLKIVDGNLSKTHVIAQIDEILASE